MKNPTTDERLALRLRAEAIAKTLPPLRRRADGSLTGESREIVRQLADAILRRNRAVGASLVLCGPGGADDVFCFGHARLRPGVPVTESTCFRIASVSKLVMSFAALSLAESSLLDLDRDISDDLGYAVRSPFAPEIPVTMRMLLTHTAGLTAGAARGARQLA